MRGPPSRYASVSDSCLWPVYGVIAYREGGAKNAWCPPLPPHGTPVVGNCPGWEMSGVGSVRVGGVRVETVLQSALVTLSVC